MTDNVNHPKHYTQDVVECIDALAAATINLKGIDAVCTANAIKYLWRWGQKAPVWRAIYLVMDQLPEVVLCVALILCGIWLVRGPRAKKAAPEAAAPEETDFQEYQPEKKMPSLLDRFARKAEPDTTGEVTLDPEDEDDGREEE